MKHYSLFLSILMICSATIAGNSYVPLKKAKTATPFILVASDKQASVLKEKISKYPKCTGIKIDTKHMSRTGISDLLHFITTHREINDLFLQYDHHDSIDFQVLSRMKSLQSLCLQNTARDYSFVSLLDGLPNLNSLSLYVDHISQVPAQVARFHSLGELNLLNETYQETLATDIYFYYKLNDTLYNYIEMNSYVDQLDLSSDSVKRAIFATWPGAEEKSARYPALKGNGDYRVSARPDPITFYQPNPNFKPLVLKDNPNRFEKAFINSLIENTLLFNDGTMLNIPEAAFVTKSGQPAGEDVHILYRTVRTPADMLASGITMFYDTSGQQEMFKTNGMFEIRAFAGSEELMLKKDKQITVDFQTNRDSGNFNLYEMNDNNGKWQYNASIVNALVSVTPEPMSVAGNMFGGSFATMIDRTEFADRYNDLNYTYLLPKGVERGRVDIPSLTSNKRLWNHVFTINTKKSVIRPGKTLLKLRVETQLSDNKQGKVLFTLHSAMFVESIDRLTAFFPELKPFEGFIFEYDGFIKTSEFSKLYRRGKCYNDCRIYYNNDEDNAIIELKTKNGFIQIPVKTTYMTVKGNIKSRVAFKRAYRKYQRLLAIKETKFNRTVYTTLPRWFVSDSSAYNLTVVKQNANSQYRLNINMLGMFNCDRIYRIKNPTQLIQPQFVCNGSILENVAAVYVVDNSAGGTYTYSPLLITISRKNTGGLVLCSSTGDIYTCKAEDYRKQVPDGNEITGQVIEVEKMPKETTADHIVQQIR